MSRRPRCVTSRYTIKQDLIAGNDDRGRATRDQWLSTVTCIMNRFAFGHRRAAAVAGGPLALMLACRHLFNPARVPSSACPLASSLRIFMAASYLQRQQRQQLVPGSRRTAVAAAAARPALVVAVTHISTGAARARWLLIGRTVSQSSLVSRGQVAAAFHCSSRRAARYSLRPTASSHLYDPPSSTVTNAL